MSSHSQCAAKAAVAGQPPVTPIPAATVVPLRDGPRGLEVLLLKRNEALVFAPGAWVFPGGRIDAGDYLSLIHI